MKLKQVNINCLRWDASGILLDCIVELSQARLFYDIIVSGETVCDALTCDSGVMRRFEDTELIRLSGVSEAEAPIVWSDLEADGGQ